ncbi:MAG: FadR/GntR family transcriptional regulator [Pseudomonadota bacterium]
MDKKIYQRIAEQIERDIDAARYRPGDRLPAERELAASLGVSRTSLREALLALEFAGRIEIRDRAGVFVRQVDKTATPRATDADPPGPYEVLEARRLVEGELTYRAALRASEADVKAITASAHELFATNVDDLERFVQLDRAFHVLIADAAGNSALADMCMALWDQRDGPLWSSWYQGTRSRQNRLRSARQHGEIAAFIAARQASAARAAMERHIDTITERFLRYGEAPIEPPADAAQ